MSEGNTGQQRTCIACRRVANKDELIRLANVQGQVVADLLGRLGGRGVYVCALESCFLAAFSNERLSRGLKQKMAQQDVLLFVEGLKVLLVSRIVSLLHMAQKAGMMVVGATAVGAHNAKNETAFMIIASDLSERSVGKLLESPRIRRFVFLNKDALGAAFGRESVGVAAVLHGGLARSIARELERYGSLANLGV